VKIIINADDLGYDGNRDALAFSLMESKKVTSSTLMSTAPDFENAVRRAKSFSAVSFGVHLALTEFGLISNSSIFHELGIVDANNHVVSDFRKQMIKPNAELKNAIFAEWKLQIEKVLDYGLKISHLDSHHHVHNIFWILPVLKRIQQRFNINRLRSVNRGYLFKEERTRPHLRSNLRHFLLKQYCCARTPDFFATFEEGSDYLAKHPGFDVDAIVEMMCHPGHPAFERETTLLMADGVDTIRSRYQLINYFEV
jgi:predicted glycoside hydrolase/deacetylase ChbG (UPF0249 family)